MIEELAKRNAGMDASSVVTCKALSLACWRTRRRGIIYRGASPLFYQRRKLKVSGFARFSQRSVLLVATLSCVPFLDKPSGKAERVASDQRSSGKSDQRSSGCSGA